MCANATVGGCLRARASSISQPPTTQPTPTPITMNTWGRPRLLVPTLVRRLGTNCGPGAIFLTARTRVCGRRERARGRQRDREREGGIARALRSGNRSRYLTGIDGVARAHKTCRRLVVIMTRRFKVPFRGRRGVPEVPARQAAAGHRHAPSRHTPAC